MSSTSGSKYSQRAVLVRGRLVGDAPHHHAGVVLVPGDQLPQVLGVGGLRVRVDVLLGEGRERRGSRQPADDAQVEADGGGLVDDDDAVPVGEVEHLLGVRVVRGAEGVRADPLHELEVVDQVGVVVALAADGGVLVLAEAGEVERLAVDEELGAAHLDGADADGDACSCRRPARPTSASTVEVVQVCGARLPERDVRHRQSAGRARALGDDGRPSSSASRTRTLGRARSSPRGSRRSGRRRRGR